MFLSRKTTIFIALYVGITPGRYLVMDVNKKIAFKCAANEVADSGDCEIDSDPDVVDCETFWETVELNIILRAFPGRSFKYLEIKPDLSNWSPFMGKYTRSTNKLLTPSIKK